MPVEVIEPHIADFEISHQIPMRPARSSEPYQLRSEVVKVTDVHFTRTGSEGGDVEFTISNGHQDASVIPVIPGGQRRFAMRLSSVTFQGLSEGQADATATRMVETAIRQEIAKLLPPNPPIEL